MYYELAQQFTVGADADRTWAFFSDANNLSKITPPWMRFEVKTPGTIQMRAGSTIDYTLRWLGMPIRWRTRIIDFTPLRQFIDLQIRGPYALWHHQHTFEPVAGGTRCEDRVIYRLPFSLLGRATHALLVRRQLIEIFTYRRQVIDRELGSVNAIGKGISVTALR